MSVVRSKSHTKFLSNEEINEGKIEELIVNGLSLEGISAFILRQPGDVCLSRDSTGHLFISIHLDNDEKDEDSRIKHLAIKKTRNGYGIRGVLLFKTETLSSILDTLFRSKVQLYTMILEEKIVLRRMMLQEASEVHNIFWKRSIAKKKVISNDYNYITYSGEIELNDGKIRKVELVEPANREIEIEYKKKIVDEMRMQSVVSEKRLAVRAPIAAILKPPTLIYMDGKGYSLDYILDNYQHDLDLAQRIKICSCCVRIMSEIHNAGLFHGGILRTNFYANVVSEKLNRIDLELVFNGSAGLVEAGTIKHLKLADYDQFAPECAFTRLLTPESGVYNIGRLFEKVLEPDLLGNYDSENEKKPQDHPALRAMRNLIASATDSNPYHRPTMHGVVLVIRKILNNLPPSNAKANFVHYDQFNG